MEHTTVSKVGCIQWVANAIISDLEEFVVDPFGSVDRFGIPMGIYSQLGHEMVNRAEQTNLSYEETLRKICGYIFRETNEDYLKILGYQKFDGQVLNIVNKRPFSSVDSEHFLCKAWLIAKLTFGHNRICKYPRQCNNHTHPSPTIHTLEITAIDDTMKIIEDTYKTVIAGKTDLTMIMLPDFCILPGEEIN
jgi:hypothetical protein